MPDQAALALSGQRHVARFQIKDSTKPHYILQPSATANAGDECFKAIRNLPAADYLSGMRSVAFEPCIPTRGTKVPTGPLHLRKTNLARLLARRPEGIFVCEFEQGEIGPDLFRQACKFGLEGLVSKRRDRPYRAGRSPDWVKVKNQSHPAIDRVTEAFS